MVGVHDSPGLEVCDRSLDDVANLVHLRIIFLLSVQKVAVKGFLVGCDHVIIDISFIAHPISWIVRHKNLG